MRPIAYERVTDAVGALARGAEAGQGQTDAQTQYLAGGTTLLDLMKLDVLVPQRVVDIGALRRDHAAISVGPSGLSLGALATMADVARDPAVSRAYPVVAQSLLLAASTQLRNMASLGGNVLQRTRCPYYRDPSWTACNKRAPGSGCAAIGGFNRNHAVLGVDESCIAQYPGDLAIALIALDAEVDLVGARGARTIPFANLHRSPAGQPHIETNLKSGELILGFRAPAGAWARRSTYVKVRDRESYEFAIASAAVALNLDGDVVRDARIALGGLAYRPWRAREAEARLLGRPLTRETAEDAARVALEGSVTHGGNAYKPELGRRTVVRALLEAKAMVI